MIRFRLLLVFGLAGLILAGCGPSVQGCEGQGACMLYFFADD